MSFGKEQINQALATENPFHTMCQQLKEIIFQDSQINTHSIIKPADQKIIHTDFFNNETQNQWKCSVQSVDISLWVEELTHFKKCGYRDKLLQHTLTLMEDFHSAKITSDRLYCLSNLNETYSLKSKEDPALEKREVLEKNLPALLASLVTDANSGQWLSIASINDGLHCLKNLQPKNAKALLKALLPHLNANAERGSYLSTKAISEGLYGLQNLQGSEEVYKFLTGLVPHFKHNDTDDKQWLNEQEIGSALYGLNNLKNLSEVKAILKVLLTHLKFNKEHGNWLDGEAISSAFYGLQSLSDSPEVKEVLKALLPHLEVKEKSNELLKAKVISRILYSLQNLQFSTETDNVLTTLRIQLENNREKRIEKLNAKQIGQALYGLRNMFNATQALHILDNLQHHIDQEDFPSAQGKERWLAEAIHSLLSYFPESKSKQTALDFVEAATKALDLSNYREGLEKHEDRNNIILELGNYFSNNLHEKQLDLHLVRTYGLAKTLCTIFFERWQEDKAGMPYRIIFGASSHNSRNQGKMREIVEDIFSKEYHQAEDQGSILLKSVQLASSSSRQGIKRGRPGRSLDFIQSQEIKTDEQKRRSDIGLPRRKRQKRDSSSSNSKQPSPNKRNTHSSTRKHRKEVFSIEEPKSPIS